MRLNPETQKKRNRLYSLVSIIENSYWFKEFSTESQAIRFPGAGIRFIQRSLARVISHEGDDNSIE